MTRGLRIGVVATAVLVVLGATEVLLWVALVAQWQVVASPGPASLDEALILVALAIALALGAWLLVSTIASLLAHLPGRLGLIANRWACTWAPALSRRVAAVLVGAAVGGALAPGTAVGTGSGASPASGPGFSQSAPAAKGPGFASTPSTTAAPDRSTTAAPDGSDPTAPDGSTRAAPDGSGPAASSPGFTTTLPSPPQPGWTPSRPVQRRQPSADLVTGRSPGGPSAEVVVHRGDTLWDIARRQLGPDATDAEVARAWPAWYDANRAVIGEDPGLILPGQLLRRPSAAEMSAPGTAR